MCLNAHPLAPLLGPLRYASARGFSNLHAIKDLGTPIAKVLERARDFIKADNFMRLEHALRNIDAPDEAARRASIVAMIGVLCDEGLDTTLEMEEVQVSAAQATPRGNNQKSISIAQPFTTLLKDVPWRLNPRLAGQLSKRDVRTIGELLFMLPRMYEDRRQPKTIAQLREGSRETIVVQVRRIQDSRWRGRRHFRAVLADDSGSIAAVHYQSGTWLKKKYPTWKRLLISGEVRRSTTGLEMPHPEVELADDNKNAAIHFYRIIPIYPGFERHEQRALRQLIFRTIEQYAPAIGDSLSQTQRRRLELPGLSEALRFVHFPPSSASLMELNVHASRSHKRLAFDEFFLLQLGIMLRRQSVKAQPGIVLDASLEKIETALKLLPFQLTGAQHRAMQNIAEDMARDEAMNRLLQGDVGSGKTAVALMATALAVHNEYQVVVMAPTEILAEQHHHTFSKYLAPIASPIALLTGSGSPGARSKVRRAIADGVIRIIIGTHALIQECVKFPRLGLVIIDEQHRFGVVQRHELMAKGLRPNVLVMTATPIPRTLAMTVYGDLDVSVIDELPPGRMPIETRVFAKKTSIRAFQIINAELAKNHQVFVIYPLVEESEKVDLENATQGVQFIQTQFPSARVGLLHGRMSAHDKERTMAAFRAQELDILVSTTVLEVGVDVPNASVMLIQNAERFGLSQLHQLRGRVGRGAAKSYCILLTGYALSTEAVARLQVMEETTNGFVIAERDLQIRGPGEFLGTRQSGLPEMTAADLVRDQTLLHQAQSEARAIVERDPNLTDPEHSSLLRALEGRWGGRLRLAQVG